MANLYPQTPPPAAAPPPPGSETQSLLGHGSYGSYQQQDEATQPLRDQMHGQAGTSSYEPNISHYNHSAVYSSFGDINLRPNIGEMNWADTEILGMALHEILKSLQWSNIITCAMVIVLEVLVAIFRIFSPAKLVLGIYLAFFASLLLRVEVSQIIKQHKQLQQLANAVDPSPSTNQNGGSQDGWIAGAGNGILGNSARIPDVGAPVLRDNFGLLFHPSGKVCILLLMSSMCVGQHNNIFELVLGGLFGLNAFFTVYLLCRYPSYKTQEDIPVPLLPPSPGAERGKVRPAAWSYYENDASSLWQVTTTIAEGASMLTSTGTTNKNEFYI